ETVTAPAAVTTRVGTDRLPVNVVVPECETLPVKVDVPESVLLPFSSGIVAPDVPVFCVAAVPNDTPFVFVTVSAPVPVFSVPSPPTVNPPNAPALLYCTCPDEPPGVPPPP